MHANILIMKSQKGTHILRKPQFLLLKNDIISLSWPTISIDTCREQINVISLSFDSLLVAIICYVMYLNLAQDWLVVIFCSVSLGRWRAEIASRVKSQRDYWQYIHVQYQFFINIWATALVRIKYSLFWHDRTLRNLPTNHLWYEENVRRWSHASIILGFMVYGV